MCFEKFYKVTRRDIALGRARFADAFKDDPVWNKVFEGETDLNTRFESFFEVPLRHCLKYGEVYAPSEELEGMVAFVPGQFADMGFWRLLMAGSLGAAFRMGPDAGKKMGLLGEVLVEERRNHMGDKPFIYLQTLGVVSSKQGQGIGDRLLSQLIQQCRKNECALYLETETEQNVQFYEKRGFKTLNRVDFSFLGLPMWTMALQPE